MKEKISDLPLIRLTAGEILEERGQEEKAIGVPPDTTIREALRLMLEKKIGSILVMEGEEVKGIWTERDLMCNTMSPDFDPGTAKIVDHMSANLHYAAWEDTVLQLIDKFFGYRIRHLLIKKEGKFAGLLSAGAVIRAGLSERTRQFKELNTMVSWEFYEDWKWSKKKDRDEA